LAQFPFIAADAADRVIAIVESSAMDQKETLRSALPLLLFALLAGAGAWACFGDRGILATRALRAEIADREALVAERERTVAGLRHEIALMQSDPGVQERWIREELSYVRPGEVLYVFPDDRTLDLALLADRRIGEPGTP
jgi:cell division protein FtsB